MGINNGRMEFSAPLPSPSPCPVCLRQEAPEGNTDARAAPSLCIAALDAFAATAGEKKEKKPKTKLAIPTRADGSGATGKKGLRILISLGNFGIAWKLAAANEMAER